MILADTSIWIDHFRTGSPALSEALRAGTILSHPCIIGELALGNLRRRKEISSLLSNLPPAVVATDAEVLTLIEQQKLFGLGIGYVDAHLLASTRLTPGARLWTIDRRLHAAASRLGNDFSPHDAS